MNDQKKRIDRWKECVKHYGKAYRTAFKAYKEALEALATHPRDHTAPEYIQCLLERYKDSKERLQRAKDGLPEVYPIVGGGWVGMS